MHSLLRAREKTLDVRNVGLSLSGVREASRVGQFDDEVLELDELLGLLLSHELVAIRIHITLNCLVLVLVSCSLLLLSRPISSRRLSVVVLFASQRRARLPDIAVVVGSPHLLDGLPVVVYDVALVRQVGVQEASKYHDLVVRDGHTAELTPLLVLELTVEVD